MMCMLWDRNLVWDAKPSHEFVEQKDQSRCHKDIPECGDTTATAVKHKQDEKRSVEYVGVPEYLGG